MINNELTKWFECTEIGQYVADREKLFFCSTVKNLHINKAMQAGMHEWLLLPEQNLVRVGFDIHMNLAEQPWAEQSLDLVLMPHALECSREPQRVLAEAYRVLKPEGRLILTGFNPYSLWRFSRWFDGYGLPKKSECWPLPVLKRQAYALGFCVEAGRFMVYVPPVKSRKSLYRWRFMESAGDRWWPHAAAVYGLVLLKRQVNVRLLPEFERDAEKESGMVLGVARTGAK